MQEIATLVNSLAMTGLVLHVIARVLAPATISYGLSVIARVLAPAAISYGLSVIARVLAPAAISYGLPVIASERSERGNLIH